MDCKKFCLPGICLPILLIFASTAFAGPLPLTPLAPVPGPSFADGNQFGDLIIGPISVYFQETGGAFSGWLHAWAWENDTNLTFAYRIEMDPTPPDATVDKFRLATALPPHLAVEEITSIGYNTYYTGLNPDAAPAKAWCGIDGVLTAIDFDFTDADNGDNTGLPEGVTTELFLETTTDVDIDSVYAIFINAGVAVEETISGVVAPGPPPLIPEPATLALILGGLAGIIGAARRRIFG